MEISNCANFVFIGKESGGVFKHLTNNLRLINDYGHQPVLSKKEKQKNIIELFSDSKNSYILSF